MELEQAQELFEEIMDLCHLTGNPRLIETVDYLYNEVNNAKDTAGVIASCQELQVVINEIDILPDEEESIIEMQTKIESLSE